MSLLAGAATGNLTPIAPAPLFGYPNVRRISTGIHDPILASALYLADTANSDRGVVLMSLDLLLLEAPLARRLRTEVVPCLGLPRSPLSALAYEWAGVQNMVFLLLDHEARARRVLALMEAQEAPILDAVCELAPPLVHFPDNLSSDNLAGLYDEYLAPTHRRRLQRLHAAGIKAAVHLDGTVRGLLPKLAAAGFDAVEALTPQPAGDLTPAEMRRLANRSDLILWGGVPGALFPAPTDWPRMRRHLDELIEAWAGQPFVLGVADQVPPDGNIDFCRLIAERLSGATTLAP